MNLLFYFKMHDINIDGRKPMKSSVGFFFFWSAMYITQRHSSEMRYFDKTLVTLPADNY